VPHAVTPRALFVRACALAAGGGGASSGGFFDDEPQAAASACSDPRFSAAQTMQLVMAERQTEEREKSINQVAESVGELAEIFKEIQVSARHVSTRHTRAGHGAHAHTSGAAVRRPRTRRGWRSDHERHAHTTRVELLALASRAQVLVIDQGTILDRIDYNIEQAADRVGHAVVELNKANEYQKRSKTMLCIYILLLLCGFMVVVLVLKKAALNGR
jgi:t-SNARE complex subunit (syntaxin)